MQEMYIIYWSNTKTIFVKIVRTDFGGGRLWLASLHSYLHELKQAIMLRAYFEILIKQTIMITFQNKTSTSSLMSCFDKYQVTRKGKTHRSVFCQFETYGYCNQNNFHNKIIFHVRLAIHVGQSVIIKWNFKVRV